MSATKYLNDFKALLGKRLAGHGLLRRKDILTKKIPDATLVFEVQKDVKNSTKELIRFTVNAGISLNALRDFSGSDEATLDFSVEQCHWRTRLGRLMPSHSDIWWTIQDEPEDNMRCDEISLAISEMALPQMEKLARPDEFVRLWQSDKGQGLTEYERRMNLAKLLTVMGRKAEANVALHALTAASEGKTWAAAAKVDVRELSKFLS